MPKVNVLPLNAIRAFEAAARHSSFKRAAEELNVTHGAISRQISLLEYWVGTPLFRRLNRQVVLTQAGKTLFSEVSPALLRITLAAASLTQKSEATTLILNAPPTFTMRWLIPRLPTFLRKNKLVEIRLETSLKPVDFVAGGYDIAIRRAPEVPPGLYSHVFLKEMLTPVCSRELLETVKLNTVADLAKQTLIHTATAPLAWPVWLAGAGAPELRASRSLQFEELFFTLQAAINGFGIAIAPAPLVVDDVANGKLVFPFGQHHSRDHDYRIIYPGTPDRKSGVALFRDWLVEEGENSRTQIEAMIGAAEVRASGAMPRRGKTRAPIKRRSRGS